MIVVPVPVVPELDSNSVRMITAVLRTGTEPIRLDVEAIEGGVINECFDNVRKAIQQKGGVASYGWKLCETLPGVMIEAEFHAVWVDELGALHEVSPQATLLDGSAHSETLFVPDPSRTDNGRQVNNLRIALNKDPLIQKFIKNAKKRYKYLNSGPLADYYGEIPMTPEFATITQTEGELQQQLWARYLHSLDASYLCRMMINCR